MSPATWATPSPQPDGDTGRQGARLPATADAPSPAVPVLSPAVPVGARPVLLGGYAAKSCARVTHNRFDHTVPEQPSVVPPALQALFDLGVTHEAAVFARWLSVGGDVRDLRGLDGDKQAHVAATLAALDGGAAVVLGGRLPDDPAGGRTGKPDALVRAAGGGYHPVDVKAHKALDRKGGGALVSTLAAPALEQAAEAGEGLRWDERDLLQLAHYRRMLEAAGHAAGQAWGAIIGSETVLGWYDLAEPAYLTFSRSEGKRRRSALERYDHEHGFRVRVAEVARQRTGALGDPEPLVQPVGQPECLTCAWAPVCVDALPDGDLSRELRGRLSVREYLTLAGSGISTVGDLADADVPTVLAAGFASENPHVRGLAGRLRKARTSPGLARDGVVLRPRPGHAFTVPRAAVEVDLDMESDRDGRVYLWGALFTTPGGSVFHPFLDLDVHDDTTELVLATRCLDWLAEQTGALVYHYSPAERTVTRRIVGGTPDRHAGTPADPQQWVDLYEHTRTAFDSRAGVGLKVLATEGAGFTWRDDDPGGLQSQTWLDHARRGSTDATTRILRYNEDDVRATLAVRNWLHTLNG